MLTTKYVKALDLFLANAKITAHISKEDIATVKALRDWVENTERDQLVERMIRLIREQACSYIICFFGEDVANKTVIGAMIDKQPNFVEVITYIPTHGTLTSTGYFYEGSIRHYFNEDKNIK